MKYKYVNIFVAATLINSCNSCGETESPKYNPDGENIKKNNEEDESPETLEYDKILKNISFEKNSIETAITDIELKKAISKLFREDAYLKIMLANGHYGERDIINGYTNNLFSSICGHGGEGPIFIPGSSGTISIVSLASNGNRRIYHFLKKNGCWTTIASRPLPEGQFNTLYAASDNLKIAGTADLSQTFILENINKFEGVLIAPNTQATTQGNFAVSSDENSIVDSEGRTLKAKADNSGVEFA